MLRRISLVLAMVASLVFAAPVAAITNGAPDNGAHPQVGQLLFYVPDVESSRFDDPGGWFNCTGTLLDATTVLTAGHCTFGVGSDGEETTPTGGSGGNDVWLSFAEVPNYDILPPSSTFTSNAERYAAWTAALEASPEWTRGVATSHPDYSDAAFFLHDLGVVELVAPAPVGGAVQYGTLPTLGQLDALYGVKGQTYTAVGYGLEEKLGGGDTRRVATLKLNNLNGVYGAGKGIAANFSSNARGGTCFGDSGGPVFAGTGTTIVAVTSFGISPQCTNGGYYRVDQPDDLAFLATFGFAP
ncbi:MAG: trypsin-like serine protease [Chloroflexi bacterium]|nr:trypsin-like serine protease [Chloroflexota bacterium]